MENIFVIEDVAGKEIIKKFSTVKFTVTGYNKLKY